MSDKLNKNVDQEKTDYDGTDTEVPLVIHHPANADAANSREQREFPQNHIKPSFQFLCTTLLWLWKGIISNDGLWIAAATIIIAVANIKYTQYAAKQWTEMRESNSINREALESVQRAFVSEAPISITRIDDRKTAKIVGWSVSFSWVNNGSTPTKDMTSHVSVRAEHTPLPSNFDFPDEWNEGQPHIATPTFIAPKATAGSFSFSLTEGALDQVRAGTYFINVWGRARYHDIFVNSPEHVTKFCAQLKITGIPGDPRTIIPFQFDMCPQLRSTCADTECVDH